MIKIGTRAWADDSRKIVRAVKKLVRVQAIGDCKEAEPYQKLTLGVFEQALDDAIAGHANCERSTAIKYLDGEMPHLVALGIEPEWVKRIIVQIGLKARINEAANFYGEKGW